MSRQRSRTQDPTVELSKALSKTLRHAAVQQGIPIDANGYCLVSDLLAHSRYQKLGATEESIRHVVETNTKKRFEYDSTNTKLRARQGHSIEVDVELFALTAETLPLIVVHGTNFKAWETIKIQGLKRMGRLHIHMAAGLPGEVISGMRSSASVLIYIDAPAALADGIAFYRSANGAILSDGRDGILEPKYFSKVLDRKGNSLL